jgi:hypothetical protein
MSDKGNQLNLNQICSGHVRSTISHCLNEKFLKFGSLSRILLHDSLRIVSLKCLRLQDKIIGMLLERTFCKIK